MSAKEKTVTPSILNVFRDYLSLGLLFVPAVGFCVFLYYNRAAIKEFSGGFPYLPVEFLLIALFGIVATVGGVLDWFYHRNELQMKISIKEREAEAKALGLGGVPMFLLLWFATFSTHKNLFLLPIIIVLIYTVVLICYDEFVFHIKRCEAREHFYHKMLVFGNGFAWLSWMYYIYY